MQITGGATKRLFSDGEIAIKPRELIVTWLGSGVLHPFSRDGFSL